jgi:hypothetical protein
LLAVEYLFLSLSVSLFLFFFLSIHATLLLPAAHERGRFAHAGKLAVRDVSAEAPNVAPSVVGASPLEIPSTKIQDPLEILRRGFRTPA